MREDSDPTKVNLQTNVKKDSDPTIVRMKGTAIHGNTPFDVPFISNIAPNLWQGGYENGLILPQFIKNVVSLYPWGRYRIKHGLDSFLEVMMYDSLDQVNGEDAGNEIDEIARWVYNRRWHGPVLVHCQAGLNRSSLIVARVLMMDGYTAEDAINTIRKNRSPACLCNPAFEEYIRGLK